MTPLPAASRPAPRARKAPPKRGGKGRKKPAPVEVTVELLAGVPVFSSLPRALLDRLAPRVRCRDLPRGALLYEGPPLEDDESPVFVVVAGDVEVRRAEGPDAPAVVNFLRPGEAYVQKLFAAHCQREAARTATLRLATLCPVRVLELKYRDVNYLLKKDAIFRGRFGETIREITRRQTERFDDAYQRDVAAFFVEQRLTFAGRVKIKRMDLCIECDGCYDACRERHGTDRLGTSEVRYGVTEIPQSCHNCGVPECIDKCKFGHISVHPVTQEIVIADDCIGCTMCARGCSFGSIRMHPLADLDVARYFPNRDPNAKGKNIAQKCDDCTGYSDRACITACPTGALFQVDGRELFDHWQQFTVHRARSAGGVAPPEPRSLGWRRFWIAFIAINALVLAWECFGRLSWPGATFGHLFHRWGLTTTELDPLDPFRAGDFFSHALGYVGASCLVLTQLYRLGKWKAPRWGSVQAWMETHVWLGILGGLYGLFHTAFFFHGLVSVAAFVAMMIAVVTGIAGRYVLALVPRSRAGRQLALDETEARVLALNQEIEELFDDQRQGISVVTRGESVVASVRADSSLDEEQGLISGLVQIVGEDREQRRRLRALVDEVERGGVRAGIAAELLRRMQEKARYQRSLRRHAFLGQVLRRYRVVHVVASNILFAALLLHIAISLFYRVGN